MSTDELNATLVIRSGLQGGPEPWSDTTTLVVDANGFHDPDGIGRGGSEPEVLTPQSVAELLPSNLDRDALRALLGHIVQLRDVL